MIHRLRTIDAHAAGEPLRLIVEGYPSPVGRTMLEKRSWVMEHHDALRRALMFEPRGHLDMYGAVLTEPVTSGSHAHINMVHRNPLGIRGISKTMFLNHLLVRYKLLYSLWMADR